MFNPNRLAYGADHAQKLFASVRQDEFGHSMKGKPGVGKSEHDLGRIFRPKRDEMNPSRAHVDNGEDVAVARRE